MPNHVYNELTIHGATLEQVRSLVSDGKRVTFSKLLPLPLELNPSDAAAQVWGVKWDAYGGTIKKHGNDVVVIFETAWSTPKNWVVALFHALRCSMTHCWAEEGFDDVVVERYSIAEQAEFEWSQSTLAPDDPEYSRIRANV